MHGEHRFGGAWTEVKLRALADYLAAYTTALKHQPFELHYVDGFAGTGSYVRTGGGDEHAGSARIALEVPGFRRYHFIELNPRRCSILRRLRETYPNKAIEVVEDDANAHIRRLCRTTNWRAARAVLFLDPYGLQVEWATLAEIAKTGAIDCWFLFPLSGVTRQLTWRDDRQDEDKKRSLDRVLGTSAWREAFYGGAHQPELFGGPGYKGRDVSSEGILQWVSERLATIFPLIVGPQVLRRGHKGNPAAGPALFALYFLCASKNPRAQDVARRMATGVLTKLRKEASIPRAE